MRGCGLELQVEIHFRENAAKKRRTPPVSILLLPNCKQETRLSRFERQKQLPRRAVMLTS